MEHKVTIIVPVFNTELYVEKCVTSLMEQSYQNLEIILIDDGSTDASNFICKQLATQDNRIVFIEQDNKGVSAARNSGLAVMSGDFLFFIDSDDWLEPNTVETLLNTMMTSDVDVIFFNSTLEFEGHSKLRVSNPNTGVIYGNNLIRQTIQSKNDARLLCGFFLSVHNKMFRVESLLKTSIGLGKFDESVHILEDGIWLMEHLVELNSAYLDGYGWYHRTMRDDSAMGNESAWFPRAKAYMKSYQRIMEIMKPHVDEEVYQLAEESYLGWFESCIKQSIDKEEADKIPELFDCCEKKYRNIYLITHFQEYIRIQNSSEYKIGAKIHQIIESNRLMNVIYKIMCKIYRFLK